MTAHNVAPACSPFQRSWSETTNALAALFAASSAYTELQAPVTAQEAHFVSCLSKNCFNMYFWDRWCLHNKSLCQGNTKRTIGQNLGGSHSLSRPHQLSSTFYSLPRPGCFSSLLSAGLYRHASSTELPSSNVPRVLLLVYCYLRGQVQRGGGAFAEIYNMKRHRAINICAAIRDSNMKQRCKCQFHHQAR